MKRHVGHMAMCAPMFVLAGILIATGSPVASVLPLLGCVLMMVFMHGAMGHGHSHSHRSHEGG